MEGFAEPATARMFLRQLKPKPKRPERHAKCRECPRQVPAGWVLCGKCRVKSSGPVKRCARCASVLLPNDEGLRCLGCR